MTGPRSFLPGKKWVFDDRLITWTQSDILNAFWLGWFGVPHYPELYYNLVVSVRLIQRTDKHRVLVPLAASTMGANCEGKASSCTIITVLPRALISYQRTIMRWRCDCATSRWCATSFRPRCAMTRSFEVISDQCVLGSGNVEVIVCEQFFSPLEICCTTKPRSSIHMSLWCQRLGNQH